jgi:hypothetical protein
MHDVHAQVANGAAVTTALAWIVAHAAGIEAVIQVVLGIVTIGAMLWSMEASRAKKRHYDRLNEDATKDCGV